MNSNEIRETFLRFFEKKGYLRDSSSSLVPAGDQTLLFTNAGMVPYKDYFLGLEKTEHNQRTTAQKCVRAGGKHNDLDQVGLTARHHTFFEMLGNFRFKGASKLVAIQEAWELITVHFKIPKDRLWVTVFHEDDESRKIWIETIGVSADRVIDCGEADNFWSMGDIGPCGPCTEIFYDHGESIAGGPPGSIDADGDRFTEIWNLVFMQYEMLASGERKALDSMGLDTGMGIERLSAVLQGVSNNYDTDLFMPIIDAVQQIKNIDLVSARVIADHIRSSVFLISDRVYPSNEGRGYVLRRIIRRAMGFAYREGIQSVFFHQLADHVIQMMGEAYPGLTEQAEVIKKVIREEEVRFHATISQGMRLLEHNIKNKIHIDGKTAFTLYDTYGFPLEMTEDIAKQQGLRCDQAGFHQHMEAQKARSREHQQFTQTEQSIISSVDTEFVGHANLEIQAKVCELFKAGKPVARLSQGEQGIVVLDQTVFYPEGGGQVGDKGVMLGDGVKFVVEQTQKQSQTILHMGNIESGAMTVGQTVTCQVSEQRLATTRNHSATHLLHAALREVLGEHVTQKGSLVTAERLRFDFTHSKPMCFEEIQAVERLVNRVIAANVAMESEKMPLVKAKALNIMSLFDEKYEDEVRVVSFDGFSKELCGGTHVTATGDIGGFKLITETGIASGVRRVEAITGEYFMNWLHGIEKEKLEIATKLKCEVSKIAERTDALLLERKALKQKLQRLEQKQYQFLADDWVKSANPKFILQTIEGDSPQALRVVYDILKTKYQGGVVALQMQMEQEYMLLLAANGSSFDMKQLFLSIQNQLGGKGGGKKDLAQGKIKQPLTSDVLEALL